MHSWFIGSEPRKVSFFQWAPYISGVRTQSKSKAKDGVNGCQFQSLFIVFVCAVCKECVEISYFDFDLKSSAMVLWTDNLISDRVR
jgi:hypothetical protein